ncbi:membrane protein insertion efficiency factor YidD [Fundidesulfovibrio soli]|uniref:membrane protein insertion efficiency factor YidD n=1 Tax=Fundidesulfovibrio soli TaxID=2922716 RepID=UPI001FAFE2D2|nr:membrane protein insertion efficiency factor YidD [Fundidesulfovibrio soli]
MQRLILALIAMYRYCLSPMIPGHCRFTPSCSEYAREAVVTHGALRGSLLAAWRLLRCQPLCSPGYDPVPHNLSWHAFTARRRERLAAK